MSIYKDGEFSYAGWAQLNQITQEELFSINIGHLPTRKSLALYLETPGLIHSLAYFSSVEKAEQAAKYIHALIHNERVSDG